MIAVPLRSDLPNYDLQILLDGVTYTLDLSFNVRLNAWFMNVLDEAAQNVLVAGLRLTCGASIGAKITGRPFPGFFVVLDTTGAGVDPGISDLGKRVRLEYVEAADLASLGLA